MANRKPTPPLNQSEIREVQRILRINGQSPDVIGKVARQYAVEESLVKAIGTLLTETATKDGKFITESGTPSAAPAAAPGATVLESHRQRLAEDLVARVNTAEAKPIGEASIQDLEALAAAAFPS